jgi:hypothetical protein
MSDGLKQKSPGRRGMRALLRKRWTWVKQLLPQHRREATLSMRRVLRQKARAFRRKHPLPLVAGRPVKPTTPPSGRADEKGEI